MDFSKKTIKALAKKGINIMSTQAIPAFEGDIYFSGTGYVINDNGTVRVLRFNEVLELAK